jgi:RNA polymerase sigma-70 factor (ECF subfamily)
MDELIPTRASLISRLKDWQDQSAWQEFFDTYWKLIYGVARARLNDAEAQDVVLETMASVARHMPDFKYQAARGSFKAWLLNKTRWLITDHLRKRQLLIADHQPTPASPTDTGLDEKVADTKLKSVAEIFELEWQKNLLDSAIASVKRRVDPQKYQIFDFYVNKEWPPEKVAARFEVSIHQVYTAKTRVTRMLKSEVDRLKSEMN